MASAFLYPRPGYVPKVASCTNQMAQIAVVAMQNTSPKVTECFNVESRILCMTYVPSDEPLEDREGSCSTCCGRMFVSDSLIQSIWLVAPVFMVIKLGATELNICDHHRSITSFSMPEPLSTPGGPLYEKLDTKEGFAPIGQAEGPSWEGCATN
ncbi:rho guanine nucleotide exchange factor 10 isoform X1 [Silurus meridionalis]|nr:rho guanine nucleotide exchange factor 10 isoform X1 [Silurus meridionalis]